MCKMHTCTPLLLEGKKSQHPLYQDSTTAATVLHHIHGHKHKIVGHCSKSPGYVWHTPTGDVVRSHPQASDSPSDTQHKIQSMHRPSACSQPMSTIPLCTSPLTPTLGFFLVSLKDREETHHHVFHWVLQPFLNHLPPSRPWDQICNRKSLVVILRYRTQQWFQRGYVSTASAASLPTPITKNLTMSECMQLRIVSRIPEILQAFLLDARKRNLKERKVG